MSVTPLGRGPRRALMIEQVGANSWRVALWGAQLRDQALDGKLGWLGDYRAVCMAAINVHRSTGLPIGVRQLNNAVCSFRRGVAW